MEPVTVVGLVASVTQAVGVTIKIIKYADEVRKADKEMNCVALEAGNLLSLLMSLRDRAEDASIDSNWFRGARSLTVPHGPLEKFQLLMEELVVKLKSRSKAGRLAQQVTWPLNKQDIKNVLGNIERTKTLISCVLENDHFKLSLAIKEGQDILSSDVADARQNVAQLRLTQQNEETKDFLRWLSPLHPAVRHREVLNDMSLGTGTWFEGTDEFSTWLSKPSIALWCPGIPGAGKTVISAHAIDYLEQRLSNQNVTKNYAIAYAYCDYKAKGISTTDLAAMLLRQVLEYTRSIPQEISDLYHAYKRQQKRPAFDHLLRLLHVVINTFEECYVIIDALDEHLADSNIKNDLSELLSLLARETHLMATSRLLPCFEDHFKQQSLRLNISAVTEDLINYCQSVLTSEPRLRLVVAGNNALETEITTGVAAKCNGMFLLAKLHMESLKGKTTVNSIRNALKYLPKELDATYHDTVKRIESQSEEEVELAQKVITWVTNANRFLTTEELQHAIAIQTGDQGVGEDDIVNEHIILSVCLGIVVPDPESREFRLVHYTAQTYFERNPFSNMLQPHKILAEVCMNHLLWTSSHFALKEREKFQPFYDYACQNWAFHAQYEEASLVHQTVAFLRRLDDPDNTFQAKRRKSHFHYTSTRVADLHLDEARDIHLASVLNLPVTVQNLLDTGSEADAQTSSGTTALHIAARRGFLSLLRLLLSRGAKIDIQETNGDEKPHCTALLGAASEGQAEVFQELLLNEANIDAKTSDDLTALHLAAVGGNLQVIEILLRKGANPNALSRHGQSPLHFALIRLGSHNLEVALLLMYAGTDIYAPDVWNETPLHVALNCGNIALAKILRTKGAEFSAIDSGEYAVSRIRAKLRIDEESIETFLDRSSFTFKRSPYQPKVSGWKEYFTSTCAEAGVSWELE